jgi:hypothetical protein
MTQIATYKAPGSAGPVGIGGHNSGGAYTRDGQIDLIDGDSFLGGIEVLSGTTDAIVFPFVPVYPLSSANFIIASSVVDAITLATARAGTDDNRSVNIWSDTAHAHTVTLPGATYAIGTGAMTTIATFTAQRGAGMTLRGYNGTWQVIASSGITFS